MIRDLIVKTANDYLGEKEISGNQGFIDKHFEKEMKSVGFEKGHAWCSYFAELVWKKAYRKFNPKYESILEKSFSANAVRTYNRTIAEGFKNGLIAEPGDLVIWQYYKDNLPKKNGSWYLGHIGIVVSVTDSGFKTIEGNTNSKGGREGIEVALKDRRYNFETKRGLRLLGFIKPKESRKVL